MLALELDKSAVKAFMGNLIRKETPFDDLEVRMIDIATAARITIEGALQDGGFALWSSLRPMVYEVIKLSGKPRQLKIVFSRQSPQELHTNAAALFLNLVYEDDSLNLTTATSQKQFALDKSLDAVWDEWVRGFFTKFGAEVRDRV